MCYICDLHVPSYLEVKRVYDVCQYIFSGEGEYALDMHYIFFQQDLGEDVSHVEACRYMMYLDFSFLQVVLQSFDLKIYMVGS